MGLGRVADHVRDHPAAETEAVSPLHAAAVWTIQGALCLLMVLLAVWTCGVVVRRLRRALTPDHAPMTHTMPAPNPQAAAGSDSTYRSAP